MIKKFTHYKQLDMMDCGPTCLKMIAKNYGKNFKIQTLRELSDISREGVSLLGISRAAEKIGFRTSGVKLSSEQLSEIDLPCVLHWSQNHFVVLYKINKNKVFIADPASGLNTFSIKEFERNWVSDDDTGIALLLSPTPTFFEHEEEKGIKLDFSFILKYLSAYKKMFFQLVLGLIVTSILLLIAPFLTQAIVDIGINTSNINFIYIILISQLMLILGRTSTDIIRSWILLHVSTRINISILTDFFIKLMKLPISYFDVKMTGDLLQRVNDQKRIESFLTNSGLSTISSLFNLLVFGAVLVYFNTKIFLTFLICSILYFLWITIFLKRRRSLDYKNFEIESQNQSQIIQLINGMQEIKLSNSEQQKRWNWERIQARLFNYRIKNLTLVQYQGIGATFINEGKNLLITFLSAKAVIEGEFTLGSMMAIQYIIGQLNSPIEQFQSLIRSYQDVKISLERLNEIHQIEDEDNNTDLTMDLSGDKSIIMDSCTFSYPGAGNIPVLKAINLKIPEGKTTAIVGMSGSGKTTILKLLLRFYEPYLGKILIGNKELNRVNHSIWRSKCGVVMQDGFIFSDTIAQNIAVGTENPDISLLLHSIKMANLEEYLFSLPLGLNTKIGDEGNGLSQGQKQRILIARSVYKNPEYIFFDEATNSLDANNEKVIMENLNSFFKNKTVVVVAHRLSTVKNADNIIVLEKGEIVEQGTHADLILARKQYFELVRNQLELGN
ncbi:MAG: peptidase domain-containing ABC transporter [Acinetobacter sp.]|nr:MAG: peptidase domain-containing ABC transporter [Acinetobacter sp.]